MFAGLDSSHAGNTDNHTLLGQVLQLVSSCQDSSHTLTLCSHSPGYGYHIVVYSIAGMVTSKYGAGAGVILSGQQPY